MIPRASVQRVSEENFASKVSKPQGKFYFTVSRRWQKMKRNKILQFSREDCPAPVSPSLACFCLKRTPGYARSSQAHCHLVQNKVFRIFFLLLYILSQMSLLAWIDSGQLVQPSKVTMASISVVYIDRELITSRWQKVRRIVPQDLQPRSPVAS